MGRTMSSRDRLLACMHHEEPDYVPLNFNIHPGYRDGLLERAENEFEVVDVLEQMGTDPSIDIWFPIQAPHPEVKITYWRERDPDGDGFIRCKQYDTPVGPLRQVVRETADWDSPDHMMFSRTTCGNRSTRTPDLEMMDDYNVSRSKEVLIKGEEDLAKLEYLFQPLNGQALERWREEALYAKAEAKRRNLLLHGRRTFAGSAMIWLGNPEDFMCQMVMNPAYVERFLQIIQDWQNWALSVVLDLGVDMVSRFGLYDGPSYWGPRHFDGYLRPLIEAETELVHQGGALHAHGQSDGMTVYSSILKGMKVDVLMGVDEIQAKDDFQMLKSELGHEKSFWGGINADVTLGTGSYEGIDGAVRNAIQTLGPGGGLVLWPVWAVCHQVSWKQIESLVQVWKRYRREASGAGRE